MKNIYLCLSIVGAIIPYIFFLGFFQEAGFDIPRFVSDAFANAAAGGFSADLLLSSLVFWLFMFSRQSRGPMPYLFILLNLTIGLSCALPAYLYAVERRA